MIAITLQPWDPSEPTDDMAVGMAIAVSETRIVKERMTTMGTEPLPGACPPSDAHETAALQALNAALATVARLANRVVELVQSYPAHPVRPQVKVLTNAVTEASEAMDTCRRQLHRLRIQ